MSLRNLLIILAVLIVGFLLIQLTKRDGRSKSIRSELVSIDTANVSSVEVISPNGTLTLTKEEGTWKVSQDGLEKETKPGVVNNMLVSLNSIKPGRLAARKQDKWKDFSVDSTGTRVKVFEGDKLSTDIVVGRFGVSGQRSYYTYVRLSEDDNVYTAENFMKMNVLENAADYRQNNVLRLTEDSLTQITFDYPDSAFVLTKSEEWMLGNQEADSVAMDTYFKDLRYLSSKSFYDGEITQTSTHRIVFTFSNREDLVVNGYHQPIGMVIRSSDNTLENFQDTDLTNKLFKGQGVFSPTLN